MKVQVAVPANATGHGSSTEAAAELHAALDAEADEEAVV